MWERCLEDRQKGRAPLVPCAESLCQGDRLYFEGTTIHRAPILDVTDPVRRAVLGHWTGKWGYESPILDEESFHALWSAKKKLISEHGAKINNRRKRAREEIDGVLHDEAEEQPGLDGGD
jgi:hypothetical protein